MKTLLRRVAAVIMELLILSALVSAITVFGQEDDADPPTELSPTSGTPNFHAQDIRLAKELGIESGHELQELRESKDITLQASKLSALGETETFWVHDFWKAHNGIDDDGDGLIDWEEPDMADFDETMYEVIANLEREGEHSYVYVEDGITVTDKDLDYVKDQFENKVYDINLDTFGREPDIDDNGKILILLMDIRDDYYYGGGDGYIAGYFSSLNEFLNDDLSPPEKGFSNELDMIHVDVDPGVVGEGGSTLAHEFQHMIHWNHDTNEKTWINEGLSGYSGFVCGYGHPMSHVNAFKDNPDTTLAIEVWPLADTLPNYGASYLFTLYLSEKFGDLSGNPNKAHLIRNLVEESDNGIQGINDVLTTVGYSERFNDIFEMWTVANIVNDTSSDPMYGYNNIDLPSMALAGDEATFSGDVAFNGTVNAWAADYLKIEFRNPLHRNFYYKGDFIGNKDSNYSLYTTYDGTVRKAILQHPESNNWSGKFYSKVPKGIGFYSVYYIVTRTESSGNGNYSLLGGKVDKAEALIGWGLDYLRTQHSNYPNGSWSNNVGITGLATLAFLNHGYSENDPDVKPAIQYLLSNVHPDGSIYTYRKNYETSIAILPLKATRNTDYEDEISNARDWLISSQWDDDCIWGKVNEDNWYWGGFGYGTHTRPDLSNTQFSLLALNAADLAKSDPTWTKAAKFVSRSQNRQASNDGFSPHDDGGFIYHPGGCLTPGCASYGSMTGAGIWGLALSGLTPEDPRFAAALDWVEDNYTWDYNPTTGGSWGNRSLYYYYLSMSKALSMARKTKIGGILGIGAHDWYKELTNKLENLQRDDGSWVNSYAWLWENYPHLATSYAILALQTRQLPPDADLEMVIIIHSPADIHLYDEEGRHVGKNYVTGGIDLEIPGSSYSAEDPQTISISQPSAGNYHLELVGRDEGNWSIEIIGHQDGTQVSYDTYSGSISEGTVLATDLNVGAFEGGLTIFSSEPTAAPVLDVDPTSLMLMGQPGQSLQASFLVNETGGGADIQSISVFATDLDDGFGNIIPSGSLNFDPSNFDVTAGGSQEVLVTVPLAVDLPDGLFEGSITVESLNAGTKSIQLTVEVVSNSPPTAEANGPYEGYEGVPITLDGSGSSDPDDSIASYEWDLDNDGEYDDATVVTVDVTFWDDGNYTIGLKVTDEYGASDTDSASVTVLNVEPSVEADPIAQTVQYSDYITEITITALDMIGDTLVATPTSLPNDLTLIDDGCIPNGNTQTCTWTISGIVNVPSAEYPITITVDDLEGGQSYVEITISVLPEEAMISFDDENPIAVQVADPGENSGPFSLDVEVNEKLPDLPDGSSAAGDIGNAMVSMDLVPVGPGGPVSGTCNPGTVEGSGHDAILPVTCDFDDVQVNTYTIQVTVDGGFYEGTGEDVLVIFDPSLGFTTGGGWFFWPGTEDRTNFGYTMKYNKKGQQVKGNLLLIRHLEDGTIYRVKSNALYGLALGDAGDFGWASFNGKSTYLEPGWDEPIGNYEFLVYVEDHDSTDSDRFWIEIHDKDGNLITIMSINREAVDNAVEIGGGNIVVPHTPGGGD